MYVVWCELRDVFLMGVCTRWVLCVGSVVSVYVVWVRV